MENKAHTRASQFGTVVQLFPLATTRGRTNLDANYLRTSIRSITNSFGRALLRLLVFLCKWYNWTESVRLVDIETSKRLFVQRSFHKNKWNYL